MEPPSSINSDQSVKAGPHSDDPLPESVNSTESFLIVTHPCEDEPGSGFVVCAYSALTGLKYVGTTGLYES